MAKIINGKKYLHIGWYNLKSSAEFDKNRLKVHNPNNSYRIVKEKGAKNTVNQNKIGYSLYMSHLRK